MEQRQMHAESLQYQDLLLDRLLTQDITQEISLPDYQPEIKRLLRVSATTQPPTRYIGGGNIEFSGNIDFSILYAAEDGALYCFPFTSEYVLHTTADADSPLSYFPDDALCCYATPEAEIAGGRVLGPRKLNVRCRVRAQLHAWGSCSAEEEWHGTLAGTPQRLWDEVTCAKMLQGSATPLSVHDEILLERDLAGEDTRIITADTTLMPEEITPASDRVNCRGQLYLKLMLQRDPEPGADGEQPTTPPPVILQRKIPFTAEIPVEGLLPGGEATVSGSCTELNLTLEDGKLLCDATLALEARTQHKESLTYTRDLCCIGQQSTVEQQSRRVPHPIRCFNTNLSQSETVTAQEIGAPTAATLIDTCATVLPDSVSISVEGNRCILVGSCHYHLLYHSDGEFSIRELERPFRCSIDMGQSRPDSTALGHDATVCVIHTKARSDDREGRVSIDTELGIALRLWEHQEISPIATVSLGEQTHTPIAQRTIYYPAPEETLWSVAKRYCTDVDALSRKNHLPDTRADHPDSLSDTHILIV